LLQLETTDNEKYRVSAAAGRQALPRYRDLSQNSNQHMTLDIYFRACGLVNIRAGLLVVVLCFVYCACSLLLAVRV